MQRLRRLLTPRLNKFIPHVPTPKQTAALLYTGRDLFYGGAAGGGKSDYLLMAGLQYVDVPRYAAIMLRDNYKNLAMPGALMDRLHTWLRPFVKTGEVRWHPSDMAFVFRPGEWDSVLRFGHLEGPRAHLNYDSAEFQFVGIDEIVSIPKYQARYMFARTRRLAGSGVPIRFRCASNPPKREQTATGAWVKDFYVTWGGRVDPDTHEPRVFISAKLNDNPYLDQDEYRLSLASMDDPITQAQMEDGDWDVEAAGNYMQQTSFRYVEVMPENVVDSVRFWDMAATEPSKSNKTPCYTVGALLHLLTDGRIVVEDVIRVQVGPAKVEALIEDTAKMDGREVRVHAEQEGGSSGKIVIEHLRRMLIGWTFSGETPHGNKFQRATPFINQVERHNNVYLLRADWNKAFVSECVLFPEGKFKDQVDAAGGALQVLTGESQPNIREVG